MLLWNFKHFITLVNSQAGKHQNHRYYEYLDDQIKIEYQIIKRSCSKYINCYKIKGVKQQSSKTPCASSRKCSINVPKHTY